MDKNELLKIIDQAAQTGQTLLYLSHKGIKDLPPEIGRLKNLTKLHLVENQLTSLPPELGQLKNLTELLLLENQLNSLPPELGQLKNLNFLSLSKNQLTSLPPELGQLKNLTELYLYENQLKELPPELGQLKNLTEISLYGNQLRSLPPELGQLKNLTNLNLGGNQLTSIPPELCQLKNLTELRLYENLLSFLPPELGQLKKLKMLFLGGNPLESPPPEVVKQGTKAVLAYLRELAKGRKKRYEAKLLILGDGNEGKTCVSRALRTLDFIGEHIRTPGVEVVQWKFENPKFPTDKEKEITLNIWDFEGQEINHQSHQFFLTEKSLYLLVINSTKLFKLERAEYWLDTIRARAPESRVILVASECENTTPSWPLDKLRENYGDLLQGDNWYFMVGCKTNKGIDALSDEIKNAAAEVKQMGMDWPDSYQKAEDRIRKRAESDAQVSRVGLYDIFTKSEIDKESFEGTAAQMAMLGLITQFKDSPELGDFVVLNPQWLTKGISLVMEDEQLDKDKGEISHDRMKKIWDNGYSGLYPTLHSCMKEFELCYDMEDKAGCLVPLRFGDAKPDIPWSNIPGSKERRVEYKLNVRPPTGIMSRFIVKTHYMIAKTDKMPKGVYWHNGVFLRTGEGEYMSESLCEFDPDERILQIQVRAAFPQNMIEQLHGFAKAVFDFFDGLEPERRYGCVKFEQEAEQQCKGAHAERRILFALSKNKVIDCDRGWHVVDPRRLVYGFSSFGEVAVTVKELRQELDKKPKWAEELIGDVKSSLVWIDRVYDEAIAIRREQKVLPAKISQKVELKLRDYLRMLDEMLDNREFNSAPAVVSIVPVDMSKFNPNNWFEKEYILTPYCECERGPHKVYFSIKFRKPRAWWEKTAPRLSLGVKVISAGLKIAFAGLPMAIGNELFDAMKNEVEFMKELTEHLELEGGAESDITGESGEFVEKSKGKEKLRDLRQFGAEDDKRIARMQLAQLFQEIAPKEYKARQWGPLRRVRMPDNTFRWLCENHAAEYKK